MTGIEVFILIFAKKSGGRQKKVNANFSKGVDF